MGLISLLSFWQSFFKNVYIHGEIGILLFKFLYVIQRDWKFYPGNISCLNL